jgi:16S rRNA (uracil1498-N3)-methyltransferase
MHRFYIAQKIEGNSVSVSDVEQLHHMRDVLRLKPGDEVDLFDSSGNECLAIVRNLTRKDAIFDIKIQQPRRTGKLKITIACAIPKKSKMDDVIDKLTQLGVDEIIPLETGRAVVRMNEGESASEARQERWKKIARSAAEQSQRSTLPVIPPVINFDDILASAEKYDLKLISALIGNRRPLKEVLAGCQPVSVLVLIGPEGDFTPGEVGRALGSGFIPVSLGDTVLRVETAAIAVASYLKFTFMD